MKHLTYLALFVCAVSNDLSAQAKIRKLSTSINHPSINLYAPYISADANAMVFISDNAEDGMLVPFYTVREVSDWREPQMLPKNIFSRLNFLKGFALSADGKKIFFSTIKSPGVGGYDIWGSDWKGSSWTEPVNFGSPVNSKLHDAAPSVSTDGNTMYFMRCEKMDQNKGENCKLFRITKKSNGQWDEATELPANINTGNSQTPRIMADGETLIFSSDKLQPGKGGMDLYVTKLQGEKWSDPKPLEFVNTDKDDQYVSVTALGRYLLKDSPGPRKNELVEYLIPTELRPKGMMKIEGKVTDPAGQAIPAYVAAFDIISGKRTNNIRPGSDGSFFLYLKEGTKYELAIDPEQNHISYYSRVFDLTTDKIPQIEKVNATLKTLTAGDELPLDLVSFKPFSSDLDVVASANELKRLSRAINANPDLKFEINVMLTGYVEDSLKSNPDLTEVNYDTVVYTYEGIDSLGQTFAEDSIAVEASYHNNRTLKQAEAIINFLSAQGVSKDRLLVFGNAGPAALPENRKLTIKAVVKN